MYGTSFDLPAALIASVSPLGTWATRHLVNFLVGLLGLAGTAAVARRLAGGSAAVWAALMLALVPSWWGHQFNNPKDVPFATAYIWTLAVLLDWYAVPAVTWRLALWFGAWAGLAMGVRAGGIILLGFLAVITAARVIRGDSRALRRAAVAGACAWGIMLLFWPRAHRNPIGWPFEVVMNFSKHFSAVAVAAGYAPTRPSVIFSGRMVQAGDLPLMYVPTYLCFSLPELFLALLLAAAWLGVRRVAARDGLRESGPGLLVVAACVVPIGAVMLLQTVIFNGIRHLLFILPPLAAIAGAAASQVLGSLRPGQRRAVLVAGLVWGAWHVSLMVRLHPLETVYYNSLTGGLPGAFMKYELDYWGNSYPEALAKVSAYLQYRGEQVHGKSWNVTACGAPEALAADLAPGFRYVGSARDADFVVGLVGVGCEGMTMGTEALRVGRFGVPLAWVRDLRKRPAAPR